MVKRCTIKKATFQDLDRVVQLRIEFLQSLESFSPKEDVMDLFLSDR